MDLAELTETVLHLERRIRDEVSKLSPQNLETELIRQLRVESERLHGLIRQEQDRQAQGEVQARALAYFGA
jgi:hypothetical protein